MGIHIYERTWFNKTKYYTKIKDNVNEFEREITPLMIIKGDYSVNENKGRLLC